MVCKKMLLCMLLCPFSLSFSKSWSEILNEKQSILQDPAYTILKEQYAAFAAGNAPVVAASCIKCITIEENNDPVVDVRSIYHTRISMMPDAPTQKPFFDSIYNSGLPSASKMRSEVYKKLEEMIVFLDELAPEFGYAPGYITIKVFEGLRDLKTQETLFTNKFNEIKTQNPLMTDDQAEAETSKWISPYKNNVPVHSTGAAVDIRLWNTQTNDFLDLGKFGTIWGTNLSAPTFSENISDAQKLNRLYLLMAANKAGLVDYVYEFWHYSCGDRYAAYWQEKDAAKRVAHYGAVK